MNLAAKEGKNRLNISNETFLFCWSAIKYSFISQSLLRFHPNPFLFPNSNNLSKWQSFFLLTGCYVTLMTNAEGENTFFPVWNDFFFQMWKKKSTFSRQGHQPFGIMPHCETGNCSSCHCHRPFAAQLYFNTYFNSFQWRQMSPSLESKASNAIRNERAPWKYMMCTKTFGAW